MIEILYVIGVELILQKRITQTASFFALSAVKQHAVLLYNFTIYCRFFVAISLSYLTVVEQLCSPVAINVGARNKSFFFLELIL